MFSRAMSFMRKLWSPQTGKGGQDREYVMYRHLAEATLNLCDKKIKQWNEMMAEDEEEDIEDVMEQNDEESAS